MVKRMHPGAGRTTLSQLTFHFALSSFTTPVVTIEIHVTHLMASVWIPSGSFGHDELCCSSERHAQCRTVQGERWKLCLPELHHTMRP
jgi:hypothetical protein